MCRKPYIQGNERNINNKKNKKIQIVSVSL